MREHTFCILLYTAVDGLLHNDMKGKYRLMNHVYVDTKGLHKDLN